MDLPSPLIPSLDDVDDLPEVESGDWSQNVPADQFRQRLQEKIAHVRNMQRAFEQGDSSPSSISPQSYNPNDQRSFIEDRATALHQQQMHDQAAQWLKEAESATSDEQIASHLRSDPYQPPPDAARLEAVETAKWTKEWQAAQRAAENPITGGLDYTEEDPNLGINSLHLKGDLGGGGGTPPPPPPTPLPPPTPPGGVPSPPPPPPDGSLSSRPVGLSSGLPGPGDVTERSIPPGAGPPPPTAGRTATPMSDTPSAEQVIRDMTPQAPPPVPPSYPPPPPQEPSAEQVIEQTLQQPPQPPMPTVPLPAGVDLPPLAPVVAGAEATGEVAAGGIVAASIAKVALAVAAAVALVAGGVAIKNAASSGSSPSANNPPAAPAAGTSESPMPGSDNGTGINGRYTVQYGDAIGGCGSGPLPPASLNVNVSGTSATVTLGSTTMQGSYEADGTLSVTNNAPDGTQYMITGTFVTTSGAVSIQNGAYDVTQDTSGCGYQFTAQHV